MEVSGFLVVRRDTSHHPTWAGTLDGAQESGRGSCPGAMAASVLEQHFRDGRIGLGLCQTDLRWGFPGRRGRGRACRLYVSTSTLFRSACGDQAGCSTCFQGSSALKEHCWRTHNNVGRVEELLTCSPGPSWNRCWYGWMMFVKVLCRKLKPEVPKLFACGEHGGAPDIGE